MSFLMEVVTSYVETMVMIHATYNSCIISYSINIDASLINNTNMIMYLNSCRSLEVVTSYVETMVMIHATYNSCIISYSINIDASLINNTSMICTSIHIVPYGSCYVLRQNNGDVVKQ